ncbi:MAG: oxalate/formate antiporter [Benniella sp.]|nr:MAG: oxalate/formate antiporter [Benniella sp.]
MDFVRKHYSDTTLKRSQEQVERERTLGWGPVSMPYNRWLMFPAAFIFQAICGSLYAWSVFNDPIDKEIYGIGADGKAITHKAPITFYLAVGFFGLSAAINGPWLERVGPRKAALVGTTLFFLGNMIASVGIHTKLIGLIWAGYGVIGGAGLGLCYISPVSALQKWFPDRRGVAAGFAVCGFGAGSIALAKVPGPLTKAVGLTKCFIILGCCYFAIMFVCCLIFRVPPPGFTVNGMDIYRNKVNENGDVEAHNATKTNTVVDPATTLTLIDSMFSREYRLIYIMFFCNSITGLVFLSRLANIAKDIFGRDDNAASTIVSINGGFNLAGRLFFSSASDLLGRKTCYMIMLGSQVIILALLPHLMDTKNYTAFCALIWILTASYGGGFGCIPAFLCDMFGPTNIGALHGIILTAWSIAGVGGGFIFTAVYDHLLKNGYKVSDTWIYAKNLYWLLGVAAVGLFVINFVRTSIRDRLLPARDGEFARIRVFGRLVRFGSFGVEAVLKDTEDSEWAAYVDSRSSPDTLQEISAPGEKHGDKAELDEVK